MAAAAELVIAVDPGREKCGIAVVHRERGVLFKTVADTAALGAAVGKLAVDYSAGVLVVGDRTSSREAKDVLKKIAPIAGSLVIVSVDEHHSTEEARRRYWQENPPSGLKRLIPVGMQVPPVPVDDYVAIILAERYFAGGD